MLVVAGNLLEAESAVKVEEREKYLAEKCPPLELPYSRDELLVSPAVTATLKICATVNQKKSTTKTAVVSVLVAVSVALLVPSPLSLLVSVVVPVPGSTPVPVTVPLPVLILLLVPV